MLNRTSAPPAAALGVRPRRRAPRRSRATIASPRPAPFPRCSVPCPPRLKRLEGVREERRPGSPGPRRARAARRAVAPREPRRARSRRRRGAARCRRVAERLLEAQAVGGRARAPSARRRRSRARARSARRGEALGRRPSSSSRRRERARGATGRPPCVGAGEHQQVLGELRQPVGLLGGGAQRRSSSSRRALAAERQLELGPQDRQRRAQLVARVGDEAPLALERRLEPRRASRSASRRAGGSRRRRAAAAGAAPARRRRSPRPRAPHRLDRPQRRRGQPVAGERGEQQRERPADRAAA